MSMIGAISAYQQYDNSVYGVGNLTPVQKVGDEQETNKVAVNNINDDIEDKAIISDQAKALYESEQTENTLEKNEAKDDKQKEALKEDNANEKSKEELTEAEKQQVAKMERTDAAVKAHEQAHKSAAGGLKTSAASYEYEVGPDGKKYAVAGEVNISYPDSSNPEKNLANAKLLKAAALAPADPSSTDRAVAHQADARIAEAQKEIEQKRLESKENTENEQKNSEENNNTPSQSKTEAVGSLASKSNNQDASNVISESAEKYISRKSEDAEIGKAFSSKTAINAAEFVINPSAKSVYGA